MHGMKEQSKANQALSLASGFCLGRLMGQGNCNVFHFLGLKWVLLLELFPSSETPSAPLPK